MRILRRLLSIAAAASLVVCILTVMTWIISVGPLVQHRIGTPELSVSQGQLWLGTFFTDDGERPRTWEGWHLGFASWSRLRGAYGRTWTAGHIELWLIALITGVFPAIHYRIHGPIQRVLRRRRAMRGLCPSCSYNLCGTNDRCPECGAPRSSVSEALRRANVCHAVSGPTAAASLVLCAAVLVLWLLSFDVVRGSHDGVKQVFLADGRLWFGPLSPGGEPAIESEGRNLALISWTRSRGFWGGSWVSFSIHLWLIALIVVLPAAVRYRVVHRVARRFRWVSRMGTASG